MSRSLWKEVKSNWISEWVAMTGGHFVPYQKLAILVAVITSFAFSIAMSHDVVFEAPVAVIDLDQSRWSATVIEKLNASPYMSVKRVTHSPSDPRTMTRGDAYVGVVFIPKNAQETLLKGARSLTIGYYADDTNTAQNAEVYTTLNEIFAELGAEVAVSRPDGASSLGKNSTETQALLSPIRVGFRYLTNPTGQATTATVVSFLLFFGMMYHGLASLMIIGRLRVTHDWEGEVLSGSLFGLLSRAFPYAFVYMVVITVAIAILSLVGQLRFAGNILFFMPAIFLCATANTWVAYLIAWGTTNPGQGAGRMIWLVPPGFILGGATMAIGFPHAWAHDLSFGVPLVWLFNFWRDQGLRGITGQETFILFGAMIIYLIFLAALVAIRLWREEIKRNEEKRRYWRDLKATTEHIEARAAEQAEKVALSGTEPANENARGPVENEPAPGPVMIKGAPQATS
ncbi:ABC transporter permease [Sutterella sp.]|uniref:ABC transporter permease n=1 Tax=Sutterella sp. TaxID=1981025 RepID=UPI0026E0DB42|nr:ABC transporter permease [Sutterella sp.]MDO5532427.1 ABC transporter permease [Sutterella sp.]